MGSSRRWRRPVPPYLASPRFASGAQKAEQQQAYSEDEEKQEPLKEARPHHRCKQKPQSHGFQYLLFSNRSVDPRSRQPQSITNLRFVHAFVAHYSKSYRPRLRPLSIATR